jgi:ribosomal-protein-alanine N-acetyltransferase
MLDEAHVTTIAVDPAYRGEGLGELLIVSLLERAMELSANETTLECRVSNHVAQALYRKYTIRDAGIRKRYYSDDGEDALIMTTQPLDSAVFQEVFEANREKLISRLRAD